MQLKTLLAAIKPLKVVGRVDIEISGIKYDSRKVSTGDLFVCIKGFKTDGHLYVESALKNGAVAVVAEKEIDLPESVTLIKVTDSRAVMADLAAHFYDYPSKKLNLIGVTGTNGKTTTTHLLKKIFADAGFAVGLLGTIHNCIGNEILPSERTTPESVDLQFLLNKMVKKDVDYVVMEVSSHALDLDRVRKCKFKSAILTNISQDHLDFHKSFQDYIDAKKKLFKMLPQDGESYCLINSDDKKGEYFIKDITVPLFKYALSSEADFKAVDVQVSAQGVSYKVIYPGGKIELKLKLTGIFNVYNTLAAFAVAFKEGVPPENIKKSLESYLGVPGRFEKIDLGQNFTVIVDYAHTPDGLENILETAKEFSKGKIISVFGCGGDRDKAKRPLMGEIAALYSDLCIITSDNPRSEDPEEIINDIVLGVKKVSKNYITEVDREKAINLALQMAEKDDIVIIAGKGHETYQEIKGKRIPFDDRDVVKKYFSER